MPTAKPSAPRWPYVVRVPSERRALAPIKDVTTSLRRPYDDCAACGHIFREGDVTTLIAVGPGDDEYQRALARAGEPYTACAVLVHVACAPPGVLPAAPESRRRFSSSRMPAAERAPSSGDFSVAEPIEPIEETEQPTDDDEPRAAER